MSTRNACLLAALALAIAGSTPARAANLTGVWEGEYRYPNESGRTPVAFRLVLVEEKGQLAGMLREANTFGYDNAPWLHAAVKGTHEAGAQEVVFTKRYDGTSEVSHGVEYRGTLADDNARLRGTWSIPGEWSGTFTLRRTSDPNRSPSPLEGVWAGSYQYPANSNQPDVAFSLMLVRGEKEIVGFMKEPNSFGQDRSPWLHAEVKVQYDDKRGTIRLTKQYDGTSNVDHAVQYEGTVTQQAMRGSWQIPETWNGTFSAKKLPAVGWNELK